MRVGTGTTNGSVQGADHSVRHMPNTVAAFAGTSTPRVSKRIDLPDQVGSSPTRRTCPPSLKHEVRLQHRDQVLQATGQHLGGEAARIDPLDERLAIVLKNGRRFPLEGLQPLAGH